MTTVATFANTYASIIGAAVIVAVLAVTWLVDRRREVAA